MPKSKRARDFHLSRVSKKTREHKDRLFKQIRDTVPEYQHCVVFAVDNMRNSYLKDVRRELGDSRIFLGKTKLMAKALGLGPDDSVAEGIHALSPFLSGTVGLLFTNDPPERILTYFASLAPVDFARAGAVAPRGFTVPKGIVYATGGEVPPEHDVPMEHSLEPELRRLGMPTRLVRGRVMLGDDSAEGASDEDGDDGESQSGYVVCREGDVLDSRQTRLLKLFSVCLAEFKVKVLAYWSSATGEVTEVDPDAMNGIDEANDDNDE